MNTGEDKGYSTQPRLKLPFSQICIICCIFQQRPIIARYEDLRLRIYCISLFIKQPQLFGSSSNKVAGGSSSQFILIQGLGDLHRLLKITIPSVTCPTTSKRHAELIDMKTFTPPIGRAGCLLSRIWTSPVPPPSICVSLMHKAVISQMHQPLRKVSLGIMAYLKGIKNVLDRLAASLIPRSRSSHRAVLYARASVKCTHNIFPAPEATSFIVSRLMFDIADVFRHTSASFTLTVQSF